MSSVAKRLMAHRKERKQLRKMGLRPSDVVRSRKRLQDQDLWDDDDPDGMAALVASDLAPSVKVGFDPMTLILLFETLMPMIMEMMEKCEESNS